MSTQKSDSAQCRPASPIHRARHQGCGWGTPREVRRESNRSVSADATSKKSQENLNPQIAQARRAKLKFASWCKSSMRKG